MLTQWEVDARDTRQIKQVMVVDAEQYDPGFPPSPLPAFQEWLGEIVEQIPEEFRETATIEFSSTSSYYDSHYGNVEVSYSRPETDEEWAERKAGVDEMLALLKVQQEAQERATLVALKAKYEA